MAGIEIFLRKKNIYVATARAGNVIGGGDRAADRIIPDIIRAYENNTPLEVRNSKSVRPWQHVLEPIFGYIKLASQVNQSDNFEDAWNFGPHLQDCLEVGEIVNKTTPTSQSKILDIGSGTGHHVSYLGAKGLDVLGIDLEKELSGARYGESGLLLKDFPDFIK